MEEEETLRRLEKAIHDLPLKEGQEHHCAASARAILDEHQTVAVELRLRKKSGTASTAKVERDLNAPRSLKRATSSMSLQGSCSILAW